MKRGTPDHPKLQDLAVKLGVQDPHAGGLLEFLWHWCAKYAPRGDIGRRTDQQISRGAKWHDDPGVFVSALVECGWLDQCDENRLVVHDWEEHCDDAVKKAVARSGNGFIKAVQKKTVATTADNGGQSPTKSDKVRQSPTTADNGGQRQPALASAIAIASRARGDNGGQRRTTPAPGSDDFDGATAFEEFWAAWPPHKRQRKPVCASLYADRLIPLAPEDAAALHARIVAPLLPRGQLRQSKRWTEQGGKFLPSPEDYLRNERWSEDWGDSGNLGGDDEMPAVVV